MIGRVEVGVKQGCVMSPWMFSIYMDGCIKDGCITEIKVTVGHIGSRLVVGGVEWPLLAALFTDSTVLLTESEGMLQKIVDEFDMVCKRRKFKMNVG